MNLLIPDIMLSCTSRTVEFSYSVWCLKQESCLDHFALTTPHTPKPNPAPTFAFLGLTLTPSLNPEAASQTLTAPYTTLALSPAAGTSNDNLSSPQGGGDVSGRRLLSEPEGFLTDGDFRVLHFSKKGT